MRVFLLVLQVASAAAAAKRAGIELEDDADA
jgi:hypothetical protein